MSYNNKYAPLYEEKDNRIKFYYWNIFAIIVTVIVVLLAGAVCISVIVIQANSMAVQRYTMQCTPSSGNITNAIGRGMMWFDSSANSIQWDLRHTNTMDVALAVYINGPIPIGLNDAPLFLPLCGTPSSLACDITIPGFLKDIIYTQGTTGIGPQITTIRDFPNVYYVEIIFSSGVLRCPLGISAGW